MADSGNLILYYRGGVADSGEIGYYTAATSMLAFGDYIGVISRATYGDGAKVETKVRNISPSGSISFDFWIYAPAIGQALFFGPATPDVIWELFKQSIEAFRFLVGSPPRATHRQRDTFAITNINGAVRYFHQNVNVVINDAKAGDALEQLIKKPMEQSGINEISVEDRGSQETITIDYEERAYFKNISSDQIILESTTERALYIESVKFREGNKWDFFDGQSRLTAAIEDDSFLARINSGEPFAKGDILVVDLHSMQRIRRGKLVSEHAIKRVKEHRHMAQQVGFGPHD